MIHILYIEDDEVLTKAILRFFRSNYRGAVVSHVDSYELAVTYLQAIQFDVVLSDFDLAPGTRGTGGSVLTWIEKHQPQLKARFIFMSANDACARRGVLWLEKPCSNNDLAAAIAEVLRGRDGAC